MNIPKFSIKQSVLINLLTILIYLIGIIALFKLPKEVVPHVSFDTISIQAVYPGTSAEDIEKLITSPIEEAIQNINGIKRITSTSFEGVSSIVVELKTSADINEVYNDIQTAVDKIKDFPEDMDKPEVKKVTIEVPVITVSLTGNISESQLREYADDLSLKLKSIPGVSSITKLGYRDKEIWVEVNPDKMIKYDIALSQVVNAIKLKNVNIPGGKIYKNKTEYLLKTTGEIKNINDVKNIILRANDEGNFISIKNIAKVKNSYEKEEIIHKSMGFRDISLLINKNEDADATKIAEKVKKITSKFKKDINNPDLNITYINDTSKLIKNRMDMLTKNSILGFILVFITLLFFLNQRIAIMTALGIPFSLFASFAVMHYADISINMISLFGFILVLGMLVDDAIVIAENSYRYMEEGLSPKEATIKGANEVFYPVIAAVLTTIAAFYPLLTMKGIMGKFIKDIPLIVIIALLASLFEAFFILPSHIADFVKPLKSRKRKKHKKVSHHILDTLKHYFFSGSKKGNESRWYQKLIAEYKKILNFTLHHRYLFTLSVIIFFILSIIFAAFFMKFELFQSSGINEFKILVETPRNSTLEYTEKKVSEIEKIIKKLPPTLLENYESVIGTSKLHSKKGSIDQYNNKAVIEVYLTDETKRKIKTVTIIKKLKKEVSKIKGIEKITFKKLRHGPPVGSPVEIEVQGDEFSKIINVKNRVINILKHIKGIIDISDDYSEGKNEINIFIDEKKAAIAGINVSQIGSIIRTAYEGTEASKFRINNELIKIIVKFDEKHSKTFKNLLKLYIPNNRGQLIPLKEIAHFQIRRSMNKITRIDLKRTITVSAEVDKKIITSKKANKIAKKIIEKKLHNIKGINIKFSGEEESRKESMKNLVEAFLIALFLIYMILATIFQSFIQPFIVMVAIPFGIIGVILTLFIHSMPLGFFSLLGIVALSGVVVNDSIVLIDLINKLRKKYKNLHTVIIKAGEQRLRPVLLTTITTAAGLFSMAYGIGGSDPMLRPLAVSFMWGLVFATFLTLIFIPTIYFINDDVKNFFKRKILPLKH